MSDTDVSDLAERVSQLERELESRRRRRPDWDAYSAAVASLVGLLALLVAGYTAHLQRKQVRAEVWPRLVLPATSLGRKLLATNPGIGPARVTAVRVQVGGKTVRTWRQVIRAIGHGEVGFEYSAISDRVFPPGAEEGIFWAVDTDASRAMFDDFLRNEKRFAMTICYCSVLDECWMTGRGALAGPKDVNRPIDRCPIADADRFQD